jgi:hypothetical protein
MRQIRFYEYVDPEIRGEIVPITIAWMMGLYWAGFIYDHEGD